MRIQWPARAVLFLIFGIFTTGAAGALTLGLSGSLSAQLSAAPGYGLKAQLGGETAADLLFPVATGLRIGPTVGILGALASGMEGGFGYRSFLGGFLGAAAEADGEVARWRYAGALRAGGRLSLYANVATYGSTTLAFFFPSLGIDGMLSFIPAGLPFLRLGLAIPLRVHFRRDMQLSGSAGLGLTAAISTAPAAGRAGQPGEAP